MAINRFSRFTNRDYNWETYIPKLASIDISGWDALLTNQQTKYDAAIAATSKLPKYLDTREDFAGKYKQGVDQTVNDITTSFSQGKVQEGNRKLRDMALNLNKDWQPGGLAYELENEYIDYQTALGGIDKYYKDQKAETSANRLRSLSNLKDAKSGPFNYNSSTGLYTRSAISPSLYPYVDMYGEAIKAVKEIKEQGRTDIVTMSPAWFKKIQTEEVTAETVSAVSNALFQQPKYKEQMETEIWREKQKYTPEELQQSVDAQKKRVTNNNAGVILKVEDIVNGKSAKDIKLVQSMLSDEGYYDGKVDGQSGQATKEAFSRYKTAQAANVAKKAENITAESIIQKSISDNYINPLVNTYAYKKAEESLIFNDEWATNRKIAAAKSNTAALIGAVQTLKDVPQSDTLVSPGAARPMEALDDIKKQYSSSYDQSKQTFDKVVAFSGISDMAGTSTPGDIHNITNIRLQSKTPGEFESNLLRAGFKNANAGQLWNFYNSPAADGLNSSYSTMNQAKSNMNNIDEAKSSAVQNYFATTAGKKDVENLRKSFGLKDATDNDIAKMVANKDPKLSNKVDNKYPSMFVGSSYNKDNLHSGEAVLNNMNRAAASNPDIFPQSLRGYSINSIKGAGSDLEKVIVDDIRGGNTLGYHSEGSAGVIFKDVNGKQIANDEVNFTNADLRFNIDAKGVTYYLTGKTADGKGVVTATVEAPINEHGNRLRQMALQMKKESETSGDDALAAQAEQLYVLTTRGQRIDRAVEDAIRVTDKNSRQLGDIVDPNRSVPGAIATFGNNENMRGLPVGSEIEANGLVYQKFKVKNPKTGATSYMTTYKTSSGQYIPITNKNKGFYFATSSEAESPIWSAEMINQIPVQVNQQKVKENTITEDQMNMLLLSNPGMLNPDDE